MGDEIIIERIEVIQGGTFQIDFVNKETNESNRCFIDPKDFFNMIGQAMQNNVNEWIKKNG
jgi:hypothetical protein